MIKLDRKRRKPKKEEEDEEQERTEVDFTSDAFVGKLEGSDTGRKGGLGKATIVYVYSSEFFIAKGNFHSR